MTTLASIKKNLMVIGVSVSLASIGQNTAHALPLTLPDSPLFVLNTVDPNVILTFDDSGSMAWGFVPDEIGSTLSGVGADLRATRRACSSTINGMAFDPNVSYTPPLDANGASFPNATFTGAWINGYNIGAGVRNLGNNYKPVWGTNSLTTTNNTFASCTISPTAADPAVGIAAFYYVYDTALAGTGGCPAVPVTTNDNCYRLVQHNNAAAGGAWTAAQQTNFGNWYSYYRTRNLSMKSALTRAFATTGGNIRIAYQRLNTCNTALGGAPTVACPGTRVRALSGTARTDFFNWLYTTPANLGTPLVQAAERARAYMLTTNASSPWAENPGVAVGTEHSCRQNFQMLTTDGRWNGGAVGANVDNATAALPDGTAYPGAIPATRQIYRDNNTGFLADVVFNAWRTDARTTLANNVPAYAGDSTGIPSTTADNPTTWSAEAYFNPDNDPARWQHLTTFTVGFGVAGTLDPTNYFDRSLFPSGTGDYDNLLNGTLNWNAGNVVDDLWHAAINGRGEYFSAKDPTTLVNSFTKFLNQVASRTGSAASLSANGSTTSGGTAIYQVTFNTSNWAGRLLARQLDVNGNVVTDLWEAGTSGLNTQDYLSTGSNGRNIITYIPGNALGARGVPFLWANLNSTQQDALNRNPSNALDGNGPARLDYLRGSSANEGVGLNFRTRVCYDLAGNPLTVCPLANSGKLGDIVNSSAVYVGAPSFGYPDSLETVTYQSFRTTQASRTPMVYVGVNDGMLHGFRADTGLEKIAYVPNLVYTNDATNNLSLLTWQSYTHRYYVDGSPTVGDVFYGGAWHTMLVGGLRKGGRGYYALDITNPTNLTEGNANGVARWEFTDADLGYSFSQATIAKVAHSGGTGGTGTPRGKWVAIFGNGYNNTGTGHAVLFVVDIETGALIQKIDTAVSGGGGNTTTPNGLATPAVVDLNDDNLADYVYAGDLQGKMWRFDIRSDNSANWTLATNVTNLFTTSDPVNSNPQPITEKPSVGFHPYGFSGLMVYFGTGKYLESSDNTTTGTPQTQTFYGIYDRGVTTLPIASAQETVLRSALLGQTISANVTIGGFNTRAVTNNPITYRLSQTAVPSTYLGWYVNLPTNGEKQVTDPVLREGRIIFTTLIPSTDPCTPGGTGWLMELNVENGGQILDTFDLNGDGAFTTADRVTSGGQTTGAAGVQPTTGGALSSPIVLAVPPTSRPPSGGGCTEIKLAQGTNTSAPNGGILKLSEACRPSGREAWHQIK